ncbi:hypothetical protein PDIDSM_4792 [Penicillium digitatum]|nr:hypothetical protein PDIDSM_4792 [Penicillium digitatum]
MIFKTHYIPTHYIPQTLKQQLISQPLSRLEDTITFHLIERVQFPLNKTVYVPGGVKIPNSELSLLDYLLREQERIQSRVRRYQSPDEYPFFPDVLEEPILQPLEYPRILHENDVCVNDVIKERYIREVLPAVCPKFGRRDRGATPRTLALRRPATLLTRDFCGLIKAEDRRGIDAAITNFAVELKVLERLGLKAKTLSTAPAFLDGNGPKINIDAFVAM